jgi:predicted negative regulator of RcsB-dependent stress response
MSPAQSVSKESRVRYRGQHGSEETVTGVIRQESLAEIDIRPNNGAVRKIPSANVIDIEYPAPSFAANTDLRRARNSERDGKTDLALKQYRDLLTKLSDSPLKRHTEFIIARLTARQADTDPSLLKSAIELLNNYRKKYPDSWEIAGYAALLVPLQLRDNDSTGARRTLDELAALKDLPAKLRLDCGINSAKLLADEKRYEDAERKLLGLLKTAAADESPALRIQVALAECHAANRKVAEAEKEIEAVLAKAKDSDLKAYAYNALGDCHRRSGAPRKAMWNYLFVDVLYNQDKQEHARALYNLYHLFKEMKEEKKAQQCRDVLEKDKQLAGKYQELLLRGK